MRKMLTFFQKQSRVMIISDIIVKMRLDCIGLIMLIWIVQMNYLEKSKWIKIQHDASANVKKDCPYGQSSNETLSPTLIWTSKQKQLDS